MSYQERRAIVSVISIILISVAYFAYVSQSYPDEGAYSPEVFRFWGAAILILIPVSIVARVIIYIVFSILHTLATTEGEPSFADERDKLIELKAARNSLYVFSIGFVVAMAAVAFAQEPAVMFSLLILAGLLSDLIGELSQFYFYRKGV